jgi:anti-sigma regulatory factor (Ser/Thr protein kinase)
MPTLGDLREERKEFRPHPTSPAGARRFVAEVLEGSSWSESTPVLVLLTSELVTNAVIHAETPVDVIVRSSPERVRVEVVDGSTRAPLRRLARTVDEWGRGLGVVETLSTRWGVQCADWGKSVWFELDALS